MAIPDCPRFKNELLATALDPDDIGLLQRWGGSLLLGRNRAQKIMLIVGTAGGGKSTLLEMIEAIVGPANVCQDVKRVLGEIMLYGERNAERIAAGVQLSGTCGWDAPTKIVVTEDRLTAYLGVIPQERHDTNTCPRMNWQSPHRAMSVRTTPCGASQRGRWAATRGWRAACRGTPSATTRSRAEPTWPHMRVRGRV